MRRPWPALLLAACSANAPAVRLTPASSASSEPALPSAGCSAVAPVAQGDRMLTSGGHTRRFRLVVPASVLAFHGTSDLLVRWGGGWFGLESPQETIRKWRQRDRCSQSTSVAYQHGDALCEAARGCAADVILCRIDGGGHTWPGGLVLPALGHTSSDLDATSTMLDFFLDHPLVTDPDQQRSVSMLQ